jgi:hypothetical protein
MSQQPPKPLDPVKRARQIRDALAKKRIRRTDIINDTLEILDQIVALEEKRTA